MPSLVLVKAQRSRCRGCGFFDFTYGLPNEYFNKHLMTGPEGNSSFCFPRISMFPRGAAEENIEILGKQNDLFPKGPVIK